MHDDDVHYDFQDLKAKSLSGIGSLIRRQLFVYGFFFLGNIVLARILAPSLFGIYAIVTFVVQFFSTFSDVGIGAALIQKKEKLRAEELSTLFWLQQMLVLAVVLLIFVVAPLIIRFYSSLPPASDLFIRVMALSFLFTSLKTVPAILMERQLDFNRVAIVDIAESLVFQITAIVLALKGFGVWSFVVAALLRSILGVVLIYSMSPWRPTFHYNFTSARGLIRFGLPYQGNTILLFVKDSLTPLFVGMYAGAAAVGYVNWARDFAFAPLVLSQSFGRVAFPAFSRIQHSRSILKDAVERSIRMMTLVMFPITAIMIALAPVITKVIFTDKWLPGIETFYFYCTSPAGIGIFLPLYSAILAMGNSRILLILTLLLIVLEWGLGVPLVMTFGFVGVAMTQPITASAFTFLYALVLKRNNVRVNLIQNLSWQLAAAIVAAIAVKILSRFLSVTLSALCLTAITGAILYVLLVFLSKRSLLNEFIDYIKEIISAR